VEKIMDKVKLYRVWDGELETVTLLDDNYMCDGATVSTYLVRYSDRHFLKVGSASDFGGN